MAATREYCMILGRLEQSPFVFKYNYGVLMRMAVIERVCWVGKGLAVWVRIYS